MPPPFRPPHFGPPGMGMGPGRGGPGFFPGRGLSGTGAPRGFMQGVTGGSTRQGGGFLSSLFGRNAATGAGAVAEAASGGSKLTSFMDGTQKFLAAGEKIVPMVRQVQQYGPLIKNLPTMWKMYRGLSNSDEAANEPNETAPSPQEETSNELEESTHMTTIHEKVPVQTGHSSSQPEESRTDSVSDNRHPKPSVPKLFI